MMDYESMGQYLKSVRPDFVLSVLFSIDTFSFGENGNWYQVRTTVVRLLIALGASPWYHLIELRWRYPKSPREHVYHVSRDLEL